VFEEFDLQVGRLLSGLKELGIDDQTMVLFTGDNGPSPSYNHRRTGGLRGQKLSLYEGGIREPLIVRWPGHTPAGQVNRTTVFCTLDLLPTLCRVAEVTVPAHIVSQLDGEDLSPALTGAAPSRQKPLCWEYGRNTNAFAFPSNPGDRSPNLAIRDGDWKLLVMDDGSGVELYNLAADSNETENLVARELSRVEKLKGRVLGWRKSLP
jgi:arylsulfatase A-like enzyme